MRRALGRQSLSGYKHSKGTPLKPSYLKLAQCPLLLNAELSIAWPDHPLAVSGGEILATRILPLLGNSELDFARAAAVCSGWRAACRVAAATTLKVYQATVLPRSADIDDGSGDGEGDEGDDDGLDRPPLLGLFVWSPCGKFIAAAANPSDAVPQPHIFIWQTSTGAIMSDWELEAEGDTMSNRFAFITFSRDSTQVATVFSECNEFAIWDVADGQLLAYNPGDNGWYYGWADFGVPGSASDGLIVFLYEDGGEIQLWDVSPDPEDELEPEGGGVIQPRLKKVQNSQGVGEDGFSGFRPSFSPDGSKLAISFGGFACVYDVASLTLLGTYTPNASGWTPISIAIAWMPNSHVLVSWAESACVWDFDRPEAPSVVTAVVGPHKSLCGWSPNGAFNFATHFATRRLEGRASNGRAMFLREERRAADGLLTGAAKFSVGGRHRGAPRVSMSPVERGVERGLPVGVGFRRREVPRGPSRAVSYISGTWGSYSEVMITRAT